MAAKGQRKFVKWAILAVILLLIVAFFLLRSRSGSAPTMGMSSTTVMQGSLTTTSSFEGSVHASRNQTLTAAGDATVRDVFVQEGDAVQDNARLLRLSDGTTAISDISGEVWELHVQAGDYVTAGTPLAEILDPASLEVEIDVDEYDIRTIQVGQPMDIYISATDETVQGTVSHVGRTAHTSGTTTYYVVTLQAPLSENVLPGMQLEATMVNEQIDNALLLRMDALQYDEAGRVYANKEEADGSLTTVELSLGSNDGVYVQILSGLQAGDVVWYTDNQSIMPLMQQMRS